ncbi:MAG: hypothetical protein NTW47_02650, partial [Proteobacteria bacterium]|nr:hypothetical protein [Pseudomonadota bacterium]
MVVEKAHKKTRWKTQHALRIGGPDRRPHRQQIVVDENARVAALPQVFTQREFTAVFKQARRLAVETHNGGKQTVERGIQQIAPLRKKRVERGAVVLEAAGFVAHTETHRTGLRFDAD